MLKYKDDSGKEINNFYSDNYSGDEGIIYYKNKKVGTWNTAHDSELGSYILKVVNGQEFHDHYFTEKEIIKKAKLK